MTTPSQPGRTSGGQPQWEPPSPEELSANIPAYEVIEILGRGGMGAVYKARQRSLKRWVAIKVLPLVAADDELKFAERFRNEAETMAQMNHPSIVNVYDFGETSDGLLYIVMEFVDGTDVHRMIHGSGMLSGEYALAITAHVCDALAYAHARGVIHRDIKPANILIDREGNVKVADFGLAKMSDPDFDYGLTRTNMAMGTPDYVAPEVLSYGMVADHRADLYAVGVMLYQMLTGEVPRGLFKMPSQKGIAADPRFDEIICRAMEPDRDERYQSAMDVRQALDVILTTPLPKEDGTGVVPVADVPPKVVAKGTRRSEDKRALDRSARAPVKSVSYSGTMIVIGTTVTVLAVTVFLVFGRNGTSPTGTPASSQPVPPQSPITGSRKLDTHTTSETTQGISPVSGPKIDWTKALPGEAPPWSSEWNLKDGTLKPSAQLRRQFGLMKDGSVRLRVRLAPDYPEADSYGPQLQLTIRSGSLAGASERTGHLQFQTYVPGRTASLHFQEKTTPGLPVEEVLAGKPQRISELDSREVEWEFRAVGDEYSAWADGQLVGTLRDARISSGYCTLEVRPGIEITRLETTGLTPTKPGPSPSKQAGTKPKSLENTYFWTDVLNGNEWSPPWQFESGALRATEKGQTHYLGVHRNGVVRVKLRHLPGTEISPHHPPLSLTVRGKKESGGSYQFQIVPQKKLSNLLFLPEDPATGAPGEPHYLWEERPLSWDGNEVEFEFRAEGDELSLWCNGKLSAKTEDTRSPSGTWVAILSPGVEILELSLGLPAAPATSLPGIAWTDWLGPRLAEPDAFQGRGWIREEGGISTDQLVKGTGTLPAGTRDGAVRVTFSLRDSDGVILDARETKEGSGRHLYIAQYTGKNLYIAHAPPDGKQTVRLVNEPIPDEVMSRPEHTLEFRFVGEELTAVLDDEFRISTRHALLKEGMCAIVLTKGVLVKSIETQELKREP